jgi:CHAT domain-containing protein/tetratricopeptide (TPR) repeat protein
LYTPYLAIAATLIVTLGIGFFVYRNSRQTDLDRGLVALNTAHRQERPLETRLSDLNYAPFPIQRGGPPANGMPNGDYVQRELAGSLLRTAATNNPSAASLRALGQYYLTERQFDQAIDQFNKALAIDPNDAKTHLNLGAALLEKGKLDLGKPEGSKSVENFSRSLEHLNKGLQLDNSLLEGYFNRALVYQKMMLPQEEEAAWKEYLQKDPNSPWAEEAKRRLKEVQETNSRKAATIDDALKEFREARAAGNDEAAWKVVAQRYTSAGNELSNRFLDSFLGLTSDDTPESSLSNLSYIADLEQQRTGDRFTADLVQRYSQTTPAVRNHIAGARRRANAAYTLFTQSKFSEAVNEYTAAKQEYEDAGDTIGRTFILYRLAHCDVFLADLAKAQQSFQQLLSICEANNYHWLVGQSLYSLAHAYADNSEYSKGIEYSSRALANFQQFQDLNGEVKALTQLAAISQELYRDQTALDYLSQGLALTAERQVEPIQRWGVFVQIGFGMDALQLHDAALLYQKQALAIALEMGRPLMISRSRGYVGSAYAAVKMYPEAVVEATRAYEVGSGIPETSGGRELMANASWKLGDILRESGQCDRAIGAYNQSIDLYRDLKIEYFSYVAHKGRLFCLANSGDDHSISDELATVLKLCEDYRAKITTESQRNSFFAVEQSVYDFAIDYAFQRKADPIKAFEYSEASRARTLLDAVSGNTSVMRTSYGPDLGITTGSKSLNLDEIQTRMPAAAQILQYAVVDNKLFLWVVTKSQIKPEVVNITARALADKVRAYLTSVNQPPDANANTSAAAADMFSLLVAPAEPFLDKNKYLCIVPDKILHYLPFDALVSPKTGTYLVEDYNIGVAPSATVFVDLTNAAARKSRKHEESFLGVGNPRFDHASFESLDDLKSATKEVETIANFYPRHNRLLVGPRATKDNIKSEIERADVVHLAMHFILNGKSEMLSGFPLTPKTPAAEHGSDGFWQSAEIYGLKLPRTRLALLSACQTGIEQQYDAEGAVGAARPFFVAGVPVVVASLWAVDSDASAALMIDLHKQRTLGERPVTQALRLAKLDMLHGQDPRYRHPYYWAPFVVVGGLSTF